MKKTTKPNGLFPWNLKFDLKMKLSLLFFITVSFVMQAGTSYSQQTKISLNKENATIKEVFDEIEATTEFKFLFNTNAVDLNRKVSLKVKKVQISVILDLLFKGEDTKYEIDDRKILLTKIKESKSIMMNLPNLLDLPPKRIKGKITDSKGEPLPGANIVEKGTNNSTMTDFDGNFSLDLKNENAILVVSFVGFENQEVKVGEQNTVTITLKESAATLHDVVIVGYGTQKKRDVIGSIATVKSEAFKTTGNSTNVLSLLQGQASGVSVQSTSGKLGAPVKVLVRGLSSISAGTSPLYIIDGVPVIGDMSLVNQLDVESVQVLKDAAATSIYGSRGSNGVVIITTKSGVDGKMSINFDASTGISDLPLQDVESINTKQLFEMLDYSKSTNSSGIYDMETDYYSNQPNITEKLTREQAMATNTDWRKELMRTGLYRSVNLSVVGGDKMAKYFISGNYRTDEGVMKNDNLERYGLRANIDLKPTSNFNTGAKINLSVSNKTNSGGSFSGILNTPMLPVYSLTNPDLYLNPKAGSNPAAINDLTNNLTELDRYRVLVGVYGEYHIPYVKGLSARTEASLDFQQENSNHWESSIIRPDGYSFASDYANTIKTSNVNFFLTYDKQFGDHNLNLVGGVENQKTTGWYRTMEGRDLVGSYQELGTPNQKVNMSSTLGTENYRLGYFGRANYKFKDKYLLGFSFRRDGASVFTTDYRWGTFKAFSAGWILSDESFMGDFGDNHFLKIRGSYGETGNSNIPSKLDANGYSNALAYGSSDVTATNGTLLNTLGVGNLTWETTKSFDLGVDFGFFNNRINGSLAYYNKYVENLLLSVALPPSAGINSGILWNNIGDLVNDGVELSLTSVNINNKDFRWQTTFNVGFNHNEVKKLTPQIDAKGSGMVSSGYITKVGTGIRDYYLADFAGIDPQTGLPKIYALDKAYYTQTGETRRLKDANGNDILLDANVTNASTNYFHMKNKNEIPKYYGGLSNQFNYKAFDFGFLISFSGGNYIYDQYHRNLTGEGLVGNNKGLPLDYYENYWKNPGDADAEYMRLLWRGNVYKDANGVQKNFGDARALTSQYLYKGDFVKLKSITLGYALPLTERTKQSVQSIRLYGSLENLYTWTKYPGWDPEGQGYIVSWDLPQLFAASFGVSVKF